MENVLEEIENTILEEQEEELKNKQKVEELADYPTYLEKNMISIPLCDFLALYDSNKILNNLVDTLFKYTELNYYKNALKIDGYNSKEISNLLASLAPKRYAERLNELLEEE